MFHTIDSRNSVSFQLPLYRDFTLDQQEDQHRNHTCQRNARHGHGNVYHRSQMGNVPLVHRRGHFLRPHDADVEFRAVGQGDDELAVVIDLNVSDSHTVLAILAVLTAGTRRRNAGVSTADPPVAIAADKGGEAVGAIRARGTIFAVNAVLAICTIRAGCAIRARGTILASYTIRARGTNAGISGSNPPVAVAADIGGQTVLTVFTILSVLTVSAVTACCRNTSVNAADPPVAVCTYGGSLSILTVRAVSSCRRSTGVNAADPPVPLSPI